MRLHRFYLQEKIGDKSDLTIKSFDLVNQIGRVFRLDKGDFVIVFDGSGNDYKCEIVDLKKDSVTLRVVEGSPSRFLPARKIHLYQAIIKKDKFEWIVEKATELGVTDITPVLAERSEKKSLNEDRLNKICIEASEQSGRGDVPSIHDIITSKEAFAGGMGEKIVLHLEGEPLNSLGVVGGLSRVPLAEDHNQPISVFIGPEGGWSPAEIEMFHNLNIPIYSLGKQVLRSETAAIAALAKVVFV